MFLRGHLCLTRAERTASWSVDSADQQGAGGGAELGVPLGRTHCRGPASLRVPDPSSSCTNGGHIPQPVPQTHSVRVTLTRPAHVWLMSRRGPSPVGATSPGDTPAAVSGLRGAYSVLPSGVCAPRGRATSGCCGNSRGGLRGCPLLSGLESGDEQVCAGPEAPESSGVQSWALGTGSELFSSLDKM